MLIVEVDSDIRGVVPMLDPVEMGLHGVMIQALETAFPTVMDRGKMS